MKVSYEDLKRQHRIVFEALWENPRIHYKDIAPMAGVCELISSKRVTQAFKHGRIYGPELSKDSYRNFKEYMYFVNCDDPESLFLSYQDDPRVVHHTKTSGFCDLWVISKEEMDFEGDVIMGGLRSDFYIPKPPDHSWEDTTKIMREKIETFDPSSYVSKGYIQTHWNETVKWSEQDELLFQYFKFNLRKPLAPLLENGISGWTIYKWFEKLPKFCTISTSYFPEGLPAYRDYLFMFETDYEDFVIDFFSELPTTSSFFKVSDMIFAYTHILVPEVKAIDLQAAGSEEYAPLFIRDLQKKGIVKRKGYTIAEYFWRKSFYSPSSHHKVHSSLYKKPTGKRHPGKKS